MLDIGLTRDELTAALYDTLARQRHDATACTCG